MSTTWNPFPADGEWTSGPSWNLAVESAIDRDLAKGGLEFLRSVFPPESVHLLADPPESAHPMVHDYILRAGRFALIELGVAASTLPLKRFRHRLRSPGEYTSAKAEAFAGLLFQNAGASMQHEPAGQDTKGPDWLASWDDQSRLAIEVKCPRLSRARWLRIVGTTRLMWAVQAKVQTSCIRADTGTWLSVLLADGIVQEITACGTVSNAQVEVAASEAIAQLETLSWPLPDGTYSMGRIGEIVVRRGPWSEPIFQFGTQDTPTPEQHDYEASRVLETLQDAASQLSAVDDCPAIVAIDLARDSALGNVASDLENALAHESWAAKLSGVLLLRRSFAGTPDCRAHFVRGRDEDRVRAAASCLARVIQRCPSGHLHSTSGVFPIKACVIQDSV